MYKFVYYQLICVCISYTRMYVNIVKCICMHVYMNKFIHTTLYLIA